MYRLIPASRIGLRLLTIALAVGFQIFFAGAAQAHHVTIQATSSCVNNAAVINYTVGSWSSGVEGSNPQVDIKVNGFVVASVAFVVPNDPISGSAPAPNETSASVEAVVVGTWGDGFPGVESAGTTVTIPTDCGGQVTPGTGRFTGGGYQILAPVGVARSADGVSKAVSGGVRITRGFTIHCDLKLSNNLEVNWEGNHFHMLEHTLTTQCSDDPGITQRPPRAPVDTIKGVGTGRYNNVGGYTIEFTLVDAGEPGKANQPDQAALKIYQGTPANPGTVVLEVPLQDIGGGNVQAHYDQPHGSNWNK